ncbi:nocobactin polyketide synthase NbtC [Nocardia cyriacigeorgica]|uniref:nocobactin polyketide synthase NbtC n=1 Tax=Nocardia cyriacigeorgica TaxID=135487 RepID=UPI0024549E68|nr:nocobactin polyketide synthase NbtC [Nocardia cyriacigeorgica]
MPDYRLPNGATPVLISSDTAEGVGAEAAALLDYLRQRPQVSPDAVADMLFRTRSARRRRALVLAGSRTGLLEALAAIAADRAHPAVISSSGAATARRIGFVFPGQGSQRAGMGKLFYEASPEYRAEVDACAAIHLERYGHSQPLAYLLGTEGGYQDIVWEVQPALMFHMAGLAAMWQAHGVQPHATIGHSQGELAAGWVSRVMTRRDAVLAVTHRARLVDDLCEEGRYSMAVLGMDREECEALLARNSGWAELSVVNSAHILAIAGDRDTILEMVETASAQGKFAKEIKVAYPAHTSYLISVREEMEAMLGDEMSSPTFDPTEITCYGATLGGPITPDITHRQYWYWNLRNRVRFDRAVIGAASEVDTFIEVADHPTLQLAIQENLAAVPGGPHDFQVLGTSHRSATSLEEFTRNLATIAVNDLNYDWKALRVPDSPTRLPLPNFPHTRMNSRHLWAPYRDETGTASAAEVAPARLVEQWARLSRRTMAPERSMTLIDPTGRCADLAAAVRERAERYGASVTPFEGAPVDGANTVVLLLPPSAADTETAAVEEFAAFATDQRWRAALGPQVSECWLVTAGAEAVADDDIPGLATAAAAAAFRCVALEHIGVAFRHLDLPADYPDAPMKTTADRVLEAVHLTGEPELAVRAGRLHAKRIVVADAAESTGPDLSEVLILGGTGHVGLEFCAELVRAGAGRITLVSRRGETPAVTAKLRAIRALGATEIAVVSGDLTDAGTMAELAARYSGNPVTLLMHAAVDYVYSTDADADAAARSAAAKVIGFAAVLRALPLTDDATVLLCSSFAASFGGWGQALYAGTNRMLDAMASALRAGGRACASVQWGLWVLPAEADAAVHARIEGSGLLPMDAGAAVTAGLAEPNGNSLVLAADWARMREVAETVGLGAVFAPAFDVLVETTAQPVTASPAPAPEQEQVSAAEPEAATPADADFSELIRRELDRVMLSDGSDRIDGSVPLVSLGMDSLQALDLRKRLKAELNRDLPVAAILGGASLDDVVSLMSENEG